MGRQTMQVPLKILCLTLQISINWQNVPLIYMVLLILVYNVLVKLFVSCKEPPNIAYEDNFDGNPSK